MPLYGHRHAVGVRRRIQFAAVGLLAAWVGSSTAGVRAAQAQGLNPQSPEVRAAVGRAVAYLGKRDTKNESLGGKCLVALAMIMADRDAKHAKIDEAIAEIGKAIEAKDRGLIADNYVASLPILLLSSLDAKASPEARKHKEQIGKLLPFLLGQQKKNGSWGYDQKEQGDIPRTQYAVLAMWEASHVGVDSPITAWENVANFLLRVQDPKGGFGYQANDPGRFTQVDQGDVTITRTCAGLGSLYICQDYLQLAPGGGAAGVPPALRRVEEGGKKRAGPLTQNVSVGMLNEVEERGDSWFDKNYSPNPEDEPHGYTCYYLYALERYQSFREIARASTQPRAANWYDDGAKYLLSTQEKEGWWKGKSGHLNRTQDTALAVLFLVRSTQQILQQAGSGTLVGGRGLPQTTTDVRLEGGKVTARPLEGPAEQLLALMGDPSSPDQLAAIEGFRALLNEGNEELVNKHAARLKELAGGADPEARIAAVDALARTNNLDNVPTLIYALTDPDDRVVVKAVDGLRRMSRKLSGFGATEGLSESDRGALVARWKEWYLSIRPDADFQE